jgi:hypothetical protein
MMWIVKILSRPWPKPAKRPTGKFMLISSSAERKKAQTDLRSDLRADERGKKSNQTMG